MEDTKIQWHPGFVAAMNLEFKDDKDELEFESEHNLNKKPLEIDLLVIKKKPSVQISNEIGTFFQGHNIIEYKSPDDSLDIDVFYKSGAYASLYKSYGATVDEIKADDITVSIIRHRKPRKLFQYFREHGFGISTPFKGIYRIEDNVLFPTQVVVTKELDKRLHTWIMALSGDLNKEDIKNLLGSAQHLTYASDKEMADAVLEVSLSANEQLLQELIGDDSMYETLMELMEPRLKIRDQAIWNEGQKQGQMQGQKIGQQQTQRLTAIRMLKSGRYTSEEISYISGLSQKELKSLEEN